MNILNVKHSEKFASVIVVQNVFGLNFHSSVKFYPHFSGTLGRQASVTAHPSKSLLQFATDNSEKKVTF